MAEEVIPKFKSISAALFRVYCLFGGAMATIFASFCFAMCFVLSQPTAVELPFKAVPPLWLALMICAWLTGAFVVALPVSAHTLPVDRMNLNQRDKRIVYWGNIVCYMLFMACVPGMLAGLLGFGAGFMMMGEQVVRQERGSGLSRGPGYALGSVLIVIGGIVVAAKNIRHLPRLFSFLLLQELGSQLVQVGDDRVPLAALLQLERAGDRSALHAAHAAYDADGKAYLRAIMVVQCFAYRASQ